MFCSVPDCTISKHTIKYYTCVFLLLQTSPTPDEMGHCDSVYLTEVGDTQVVVFKHGMSVFLLVLFDFSFYLKLVQLN